MPSVFTPGQIHERMGRRTLCPILFLLVILLSAARISLGAVSDDLLRKGNERMRDKDYIQAIVYFESAHKADPYNKTACRYLSLAYYNLAILNSRKGEQEAAISNGLAALHLDPESAVIKERLAVFYNNIALREADLGKYEASKEYLEKALLYSPGSEAVKANLYNILLMHADYCQKRKDVTLAEDLARQAIAIAPGQPRGYISLANVYYGQDNFEEALRYWEKALSIDPADGDLKQRIITVKREKEVEQGFAIERKNPFMIRFDRQLDPRYVDEILDILSEARRIIKDRFSLYPVERIPVIVYDDRQFHEATAQPYWTQGLYDGKIRLRYQDISRGDMDLRRVLFHEYAHAAVFLHIGGDIPLWLHEGFAQFNEPGTGLTASDKIFLSGYIKKQSRFSLEGLNSMFDQVNDQAVIRAAYLESRLFFSYLFDRYSSYRVKRLFEEIKRGKAWQLAFTQVYKVSIDRMDKCFNDYLDSLLD
jgi:tetratricopeptide (TPR) repeat protein